MITIPGTSIPLCLICEEDAATHHTSGIGPTCAECTILAIAAQQACLGAGIGPDTLTNPKSNIQNYEH